MAAESDTPKGLSFEKIPDNYSNIPLQQLAHDTRHELCLHLNVLNDVYGKHNIQENEFLLQDCSCSVSFRTINCVVGRFELFLPRTTISSFAIEMSWLAILLDNMTGPLLLRVWTIFAQHLLW